MDGEEILFDTTKFMGHYSKLSSNKLETDVAKSYASQVQKDVKSAQDRADMIVNALTSRSKPPDFKVARSALSLMAHGPNVVVSHWQPFIAAVAEVLPPAAEGDVIDVKSVDSAAESPELKDLRATLGKMGTVLPLANARELRELRAGFALLGDAIGVEFGKRGMPFERDGSAAILARLNNELDTASAPEPLPKDFAFSDQRVMRLRESVESAGVMLQSADEKIADLKEETLSSEKTRSELAQAADREASMRTEAESQLAETKKQVQALEQEIEQLKKKSGKSK